MTDKVDPELTRRLGEVLEAGLPEEALAAFTKRARDALDGLQEDLTYHLKQELGDALSGWTREMATRAVEQLLEGNAAQMRRYLSCERRGDDGEYAGWTGRSDSSYGGNRRLEDWHSVIRGALHDSGCIALRRRIVEVHRDLITDERVRDLEDQVKSLVLQVNIARSEKDKMWERLQAAGG